MFLPIEDIFQLACTCSSLNIAVWAEFNAIASYDIRDQHSWVHPWTYREKELWNKELHDSSDTHDTDFVNPAEPVIPLKAKLMEAWTGYLFCVP